MGREQGSFRVQDHYSFFDPGTRLWIARSSTQALSERFGDNPHMAVRATHELWRTGHTSRIQPFSQEASLHTEITPEVKAVVINGMINERRVPTPWEQFVDQTAVEIYKAAHGVPASEQPTKRVLTDAQVFSAKVKEFVVLLNRATRIL